jgi:single-strand DNA-binding protein
MKNHVILIGYIGNDPETRTTQSGSSIVTLSLATVRPRRDSDGKIARDEHDRRIEDTEWHRVTCFNGLGKAVSENIGKGAMVMVTGHIHYSRWTDKDGTARHGCEIVAESVDFLTRGKREALAPAETREMALPL